VSELQAPLTPPDCDLRDFPFMPLDVVRLRDSDLAAQESAEAFRAAVMLWCASWHQIPAASLPDDDRTLAKLAGYGFVVSAWQEVKEGALRGWVRCSDGRLYHDVVAEKANSAFTEKLAHAHDRLCDRLRKSGIQKDRIPSYDDWISSGKKLDAHWKDVPVPPEHKKPSAGNPPEKALKGEGQGQGEEQPSSSLRSEETAADKPRRSPREPKSEITLPAYLEDCKAKGVMAVPLDHHIRAYARDAGIPDEMLQVAWLEFRDRHIPKPGDRTRAKKQKDWPGTFANAVKGNWYRLWFIDGQEVKWTSQGQIALKVHEAQLARHKANQPEETPA